VVILPDLHRKAEAREDDAPVRFDWPTYTLGLRLGRTADAGAAALGRLERRRRREETRRVLYVAMTRARETLILTGSGDFDRASYLGLLEEAAPGLSDTDGLFRIDDAEIHVSHEPWKEQERKDGRRETKKGKPADWRKLSALWKSRRDEQARLLATPRFTSPSRLQEKRQTVASRDDQERMERGAAVGTLCHRALESMDFATPEPGPLVERFADDPSVANEAREVLDGFVKTGAFRSLGSSTVLAKELPFLMRAGESILQGRSISS